MSKLDFVIQSQEQSEWCWAALSASIVNFYAGNDSLKQCEVVKKVLGRSTCCEDGSSDLCNQQFDIDSALRRLGHLARAQGNQPDFRIVDAEIKAGRPVGVRILWSDGGGHAIVVYGVTDDRQVIIADPASANDEAIVPFDGFVYKDIGSWNGTLFTRS